MDGGDIIELIILVFEWLWEHRIGVAAVIFIFLLIGIMNNLSAVAEQLWFVATELRSIEQAIKERVPKLSEDNPGSDLDLDPD